MARIVGGIGTSHAPSIAHAYDKKLQQEPVWAPLFEGYEPAKAWLKEVAPDLVIFVYNDHMNRFFFDAYPSLALGVASEHPGADEGWGKRDLPDFTGNPDLGWHVARSLVDQEFDLTICEELPVDHGILSIAPLIFDPPWPCPILPLAVNVIRHPLPTARRLYKLGQAFRRAIESYPEDMRIVIVGTGGLSHQLHGPRFGYTNPEWDNRFLDLLETDPEELAGLSHDDFMEQGGAESVEMIMWLTMRGALSPTVHRAHRFYYAPMLTGYGLVVFEDQA